MGAQRNVETIRAKESGGEGLFAMLAGLPVGAIAAVMGAATLANVWGSLGYAWIRGITLVCAGALWILALLKITGHFQVFKAEYAKTVPASLYAAFLMLLMILSAALAQWKVPGIPRIAGLLFRAAVVIHALHIALFSFRHIVKGFKRETFVPSWFVTYNGIMVSTVAGPGLIPGVSRIVLYYGLTVYFIGILLMVIRLAKYPADPSLLHTKAIVLAPVSLCLVSYLNVESEPSTALVLVLYGMLLLSLLYILLKIPRFFSVPFSPGFAGLTFPMAIGTMASFRMAAWLRGAGLQGWGAAVQNIAGLQLYLTTAIIAFVLFNFLRSGCARIAAGPRQAG